MPRESREVSRSSAIDLRIQSNLKELNLITTPGPAEYPTPFEISCNDGDRIVWTMIRKMSLERGAPMQEPIPKSALEQRAINQQSTTQRYDREY